MFEFLQFGAAKLELLLIVLTRVSGMVMMAPVLGDKSLPMTFRISLAILLSLIIVPLLAADPLTPASSLPELVVRVLQELLVGLSIGFLFRILFFGVQAAGSVVGYQIGLSIANIVDPSSNSEQSILSQFWLLLATLIFLTIDGHHLIISGLVNSFSLIPPGGPLVAGTTTDLLIRASAFVLLLAVKLSVPVVVTLFLIDIGLASVSRMMPTMNVFVVGFGVKMGAGLAIMAVSLPVFAIVLRQALGTINTELTRVMAALAG